LARNEREATIEHNEGLLARMEENNATRRQTIADRKRRIATNASNNARREAQIKAIEDTLPALERRARELAEGRELTRSIQSIFGAYNRLASAKAMRRENLEASDLALRQEARRRAGPSAVAPLRPIVPVAPRVAIEEGDRKEAPPVGEGKGRIAETRGLASLRKNYGFESMSDSDSDSESDSDDDRPFDFDDAGNDMYYSKPMRK